MTSPTTKDRGYPRGGLMKKVIMPGRETSLAVRLTPAVKQVEQPEDVQCIKPVALLACNGVEWRSTITLIKDF